MHFFASEMAGVRLLSIHQPKDGSNDLCMFVEIEEGVDMGRVLPAISAMPSHPPDYTHAAFSTACALTACSCIYLSIYLSVYL